MKLDTDILVQKLNEAAQGLLFPSESDFPIEAFVFGAQDPAPHQVLEARGLPLDTPVEETTLASFFEGVTKVSDDASEKASQEAIKFRSLVRLLEENLKDVRVLRVGEVDIEVLVLGRDPSGNWVGVRTNVVET